MKIEAKNPTAYISKLPKERQAAFKTLRSTLLKNIPKGFKEVMSYGMIGYVVSLELYPNGYHCNPNLPLPFINIASQKNYIALYHMGMYANPNILDWFTLEYPKHCKYKLDIGKSCVRFKKMEDIPFQLIAELAQKMTVKQWIATYENSVKK